MFGMAILVLNLSTVIRVQTSALTQQHLQMHGCIIAPRWRAFPLQLRSNCRS